jgi:hypothetical protein
MSRLRSHWRLRTDPMRGGNSSSSSSGLLAALAYPIADIVSEVGVAGV